MDNSPRGAAIMTRSPSIGGSCNGGDDGMLPLPLSLDQGGKSGDMDEHRSHKDIDAFKSENNGRDSNLGGLFPSFAGYSRGVQQTGENFHSQTRQVTMQGYGGMSQPQHQNPPPIGVGAAPPARPRVRARRGQATDPHSIAERLRRERIAERMKALQELVPNSNKVNNTNVEDGLILADALVYACREGVDKETRDYSDASKEIARRKEIAREFPSRTMEANMEGR